MAYIEINTHISVGFNKELEDLKNSVLTMGGLLEQQLNDTLQALKTNNAGLAEKVVINDKEINSMEIQIDEECMRIIARRHPTASDLRLIMTIAKATADIERMGDEIERVAKLISHSNVPDSDSLKSSMLVIGEHVLEMLKDTLDAFARLDLEAAEKTYQNDESIDAQYKDLLSITILEMQQHSDELENWLEVLWALRSFERIGDRCKNVCEYVIFLVNGSDNREI
ncbi:MULTISPECIES: phosphate signaling complex protein PhoU [Alteromonadaceae]|uniref:phosphate signaling complex protein PhoU n=1 Tax=Alteromonadaceae TaxID=72275 RepID=UPI001C08B700|nr:MULTISPECIES: phosphate signaling complex protein PhoU [Aliiglaciecola]MBU2876553.1 phosphate signaling complex protein PhoU [Aliiglaciecola lipolytica]MDO6711512.1 phosphate signaling complex protein PhoU [Aliiglaciecola sp. 2_MG-2023]MDO6752512.1 phosphate signaling complex protein PhoU [Aliiglaciecola sp. 1_MG-2023]